MRISFRLIPVILFFVFYGLLQLSFTQLQRLEEIDDKQETKAILDIVTDRFKRYLELPYLIGRLGSQQLSADIHHKDYERYARLVREANPEFLAFNIVDKNGLIIRVYPDGDQNAKALNRRSQNLGLLLESYEKKEPYYLSAPFRLYQGQQGFIFYVPIMKAHELQGWYAVVISSEKFLEKFSLGDFLKVFNLVIIDEQTELDYFATSLGPSVERTRVFSKHAVLFGRKMFFRTWRKAEHPVHTFPWYFSVVLSLILAGASALMIRLYDQRKKARGQLDNMGILLRITSKEALSNLIEIHSELNQLNIPEDNRVERLSRDINNLTNLMEQIDLLQTMAHTREGLRESDHNFLHLLRLQLDAFAEVLQRKNITVVLEESDLWTIKIKVNEWLFCNSVLSNVLYHLMIHAETGSALTIETQNRGEQQVIVFKVKKHPSSGHTGKIVARRIEVARKVLQLQHGELKEEFEGNELVISVVLPA